MLICPQCQLENPNTYKFCQRCGTSLTHQVCPTCGTNVAFHEKNCSNCGSKTAIVWRAIIIGVSSQEEVGSRKTFVGSQEICSPLSPLPPCPSAPLSPPSPYPSGMGTPSPLTPSYLDQQQRYQLLETLDVSTTQEWEAKVLDCQPFQVSLLEAAADLMMANIIPEIATPYISLHSQFDRHLPAIHDAWQEGSQQVILIADRSDWKELLQLWRELQMTVAQILQWFKDMVEIWAALEKWHYRQSLLVLSNLRVDATCRLGLQRLHVEPADSTITLQDLGQVWQRLFQESQCTKFGAMVELLSDLQAGKIDTIAELRSRLEAIASELQVSLTPTTDLPSVTSAVSEAAVNQVEVEVPLNHSAAPTVIQMNEFSENIIRSEDLPTLVLPMHLAGIEDAGSTDVGRQRHHNEDCFGIATSINKVEYPNSGTIQARGIYILCDGMGGHASGEVASALAVKTLLQYFQTNWQSHQPIPSEATIREAVFLANRAIYDLNQQDARSGVARMGTTVVIVLVHNTQVAVAHVGDSRLYSLGRKRGLEQVTLDHEVGQREILRGVEPVTAYARPDAYQLTQALGPRDENFINPDIQFFELNEDSLLLLVSDGMSDNEIIEQHCQTHLETLLSSTTNLQRGVNDLIDLANQYNGHDNITAVLVRLKVRPKLEQ